MIVDRSGATPKVLLGKRHHAHKFMPGKFVFPGGRLEPNDRLMPSATPLNPFTEQYLMRNVKRPSAARAKGLALAAIRETFEETGLILGAPLSNAAAAPELPEGIATTGISPADAYNQTLTDEAHAAQAAQDQSSGQGQDQGQ